MGRIFGNVKIAREAEELEGVQYPDLPKALLKLIYEGQGIQVSRRANSYVVILGNGFIHADSESVLGWLRNNYGEKLDSTQMHIALTLLIERVKHAVSNHERITEQAEKEEAKALRNTWGAGDSLNDFFGR